VTADIGNPDACRKSCALVQFSLSCLGWLGNYSSCLSVASLERVVIGPFDSIEKDAAGRFWLVPIGSLASLCARAERGGIWQLLAMEAAIFHYRVWQDLIQKVTFDEDNAGLITVSISGASRSHA